MDVLTQESDHRDLEQLTYYIKKNKMAVNLNWQQRRRGDLEQFLGLLLLACCSFFLSRLTKNN
jgi:hypothetical protein